MGKIIEGLFGKKGLSKKKVSSFLKKKRKNKNHLLCVDYV